LINILDKIIFVLMIAEFCAEASRISVDHIGIAEHKLEGHQSRVKKICHKVARREFEHYRIEISSSDIPTKTSFKPGGTLSLTIGSMIARIQSTGSDPMGRWSYTKFVGTRKKNHTGHHSLPSMKYSRYHHHQNEILYRCCPTG
jgi:hypothetical protein